nr:gliding motility-associated C-terminal domain-containing protein [Saprospiraceae bacterium]
LAGDIAAGGSRSIDITFTVNANATTGNLTNVAEITGDNGDDVDSTPDTNPDNDTKVNDVIDNTGGDEDDNDPEVITVIETPVYDLALRKTLAAGQSRNVQVGSQVTFTITVFNQGTVTASNIQVSDFVPAGLTLNDADWTLSGSRATATLAGDIAAGGSRSIDITFTVNANATSSIKNIAEITGDNGDDVDSTPDTNPDNDTRVNDVIDNSGGDEDDNDEEVINIISTCDCAVNNIGNYVWEDTDLDGIQDSNESGIAGVTVRLYNAANNQVVMTTVSDATGHYQFNNVPASGTYYLKFDATTNTENNTYIAAAQNVGLNDAVDNDVNSNGISATFSFSNCVCTVDIDAGFVNKCDMLIIKYVLTTNPSACGQSNGKITVRTLGGSTVQYSINGGLTWQSSGIFDNIAAGVYNVKVKNGDNSCVKDYANNPVIVNAVGSASITNVVMTSPSACGTSDGALNVQATGTGLEYSINAGLNYQSTSNFTGLAVGSYTIAVRNSSGCITYRAVNLTYAFNCFGNEGGSINDIIRPSTETDVIDIPEDVTTIEIDVLSNDNIEGTITKLDVVRMPQHGTLEIDDLARFVYTVNEDDCGEDAFVYELCNNTGCSTAEVILQNECKGKKGKITITKDEVNLPDVVIYTGVSPNGDGTNESFVIEGIDNYPNNTLQIFNRNGINIYTTKRYKNDWNGIYDGNELPSGTYFYIFEDGKGRSFSGYLILQR